MVNCFIDVWVTDVTYVCSPTTDKPILLVIGWERSRNILATSTRKIERMMGKVEVKLSLCLIKNYAVKTYGWIDGIAPWILNRCTRWRRVVSFMLRSLYSRVKGLRYKPDGRLGGPQIKSGIEVTYSGRPPQTLVSILPELRRVADKSLAFPISCLPICSTTKVILLWWVKEVRTTKS
jgi:hypothetical protein